MRPSRARPSARVVLVAAIALLTACADDPMPLQPPQSPGMPDAAAAIRAARSSLSLSATHRVVVLRAERAPSRDLLDAISEAGGEVVRRFDRIGVIIVDGLSDADAALVLGDGEVEATNRDAMQQWHELPEDMRVLGAGAGAGSSDSPANAPFFPLQWNMRQIQADRAWESTPAGQGALVCVLDSGIDPTHADLAGRVDLATSASFIAEPFIPGVPGLNGQFDIIDYRFHGTFVASQIATNGIYMASVAPRARLCAVKVLNVFGTGTWEAVIAGVMHAANVRADVINMSLGAYFDAALVSEQFEALLLGLQRAILYATLQGTLVIASAGNDAANFDTDGSMIQVPGQMLGVLTVAATGPTNQTDFDGLARYSNHGRAVDVAAPGGNAGATGIFADGILGACSSYQVVLPFACTTTSYIGGGDGTSFSAPHAAGLAAVVESAAAGNQFGLVLGRCLIRGADSIDGQSYSRIYGYGRIDVLDALHEPGCGGTSSSN